MSPAETFRSYARAERRAAAETKLPMRRAVHEQSAATWEKMAVQAEGIAVRAAEIKVEKALAAAGSASR